MELQDRVKVMMLEPNEIRAYWQQVRYTLENSFQHPIRFDTVLGDLLSSKLQAWVLLDSEKKAIGVLTTFIHTDRYMPDDRSLFIYTAFGLDTISNVLWTDTIEQLKVYARKNRCRSITAVTRVPRILEIATMHGFDTSQHVIKVEV